MPLDAAAVAELSDEALGWTSNHQGPRVLAIALVELEVPGKADALRPHFARHHLWVLIRGVRSRRDGLTEFNGATLDVIDRDGRGIRVFVCYRKPLSILTESHRRDTMEGP